MSLPQSKFREIVLQLLYKNDMGYGDENGSIELIAKELSVARSQVRKALEMVSAIFQQQKILDAAIGKAAHNYSFERIQRIERNILRLATYELFFNEEIPPKVTISEGMRLARKFSTPESSTFINAVLDNIYKEQKGETQDFNAIEESILALNQQEQIASQSHQMDDNHHASTP